MESKGYAVNDQTSEDALNDDQLVDGFERDSDSLWHENRLLATATLAGPIVATVGIVAATAVVGGLEVARRLVLTALLAFFVLGRFVILGGRDIESNAVGFTPGQMALMVFYLDVMTAIVVSWHAGALFRIPWLGERLRFLMHCGRDVLSENRWMQRMTLVAIVAFVMFPLASSGSVGGSLFGRLLGLTRVSTFVGVVIGSLLGCGSMYFGATIINRYLDQDNPLLRWGGLLAIVILMAILNGRYRRAHNDFPKADH